VINVSDLWKAIQAQLASAGTTRYNPRRDGIYAINGAMRGFEAMATPLLAERKGSEESLSELQETRAFQTNAFGGLSLDAIQPTQPYSIWTVIAVYAEVTTQNPTPTIIGTANNTYLRTDLVMNMRGSKRVKRATMEQVAANTDNKFAAGNEVTAATRPDYCYYMVGNRSDSAGVINGNRELVIAPTSRTIRAIVGMSYLRSAPALTLADLDSNGNFPSTLNIPYPQSLFNVIRDMALNDLSVKQGDGTNLYSITEKDIARLLVMQN
jgi:hypothetical protein